MKLITRHRPRTNRCSTSVAKQISVQAEPNWFSEASAHGNTSPASLSPSGAGGDPSEISIETFMFIRTKRLFLRPIWVEDHRLLSIFALHKVAPPLPSDWAFLRTLCHTDEVAKPENAIVLLLVFLRTSDAGCLVGGAGLFRSGPSRTALSTWTFPKYVERKFDEEVYPAMRELAEIGLRLPAIENADAAPCGFIPMPVKPVTRAPAFIARPDAPSTAAELLLPPKALFMENAKCPV